LGRSIVGHVEAIFRYPVKSMRGERLDAAELGWHGLEGDRRLGFRKVGDRGGFPWLSAGRVPELVLYQPCLPSHVRTPSGADLPVFGEELAAEVGRRFGAPVEMMQFRNGIFDEANVSVIASDTVREIERLAGVAADVRRFRPNIAVRLERPGAFQEDEWVGRVPSFGEAEDAAAVTVTMRDLRCGMLNIDPDTASLAPEVMKAVVSRSENHAGVYAAVTRVGRVAMRQPMYLS